MISVFLHRPHSPWNDHSKDEWHENMLASKTGIRLMSIIGGLREPVEIENLAPHSWPPVEPFEPNIPWIEAMLKELNPRLVLCLSSAGRPILRRVWRGPLICTSHVKARYLVDADPLFAAVRRLLAPCVTCNGARVLGPSYERVVATGFDATTECATCLGYGGFSGRIYMNRDHGNAITEVPL